MVRIFLLTHKNGVTTKTATTPIPPEIHRT
jgi:hypothetical protein